MKTALSQASKPLFKKLSELRATLSDEERKILDDILGVEGRTWGRASGKAEVEAHRTWGRASSKATPHIIFDPVSEEYRIQD